MPGVGGVARLHFAHSESDGVRAVSCRDLTRGDVVPMHRIQSVGTRGRFCCSS
jgi:hypothetical protein